MYTRVIHFAVTRYVTELLRDPVETTGTLCKNKSEYAVTTDEAEKVTCQVCIQMLRRAQYLRATKFTLADKAFIHTCAQSVWNYIGYDVLHSTAEMKGKRIDSVSVGRSDVIEMVIDADRLDEQLRHESRSWGSAEQARFFTIWDALSYTAKRQLVRPAFPYTHYGV